MITMMLETFFLAETALLSKDALMVAAVAFARDSLTLVYVGVTIGIITLRLVAGYCIKSFSSSPGRSGLCGAR